MSGDNHLEALDERERLKKNLFPKVQTVLVVLSSDSMAFDREALHYKIFSAYPDSSISFRTTSGKPIGRDVVKAFDLLIDFTGPGQRQAWFLARKLKKISKHSVGRNAGFFRKRIYDRIFDESDPQIAPSLPKDLLEHERIVQRKVLELAGVPMVPAAGVTRDKSKTIALDLPPLARG